MTAVSIDFPAPPPTLPSAYHVELRGGPALIWDWAKHGGMPPEVVIEGAYGTGKTRGTLEVLHAILSNHANVRALITRKTLTSLTASALVTLRKQVIRPGDARFFGGNKERAAAYEYGNGSELVVGGMDRPDKILSTEYDIIYAVECRELSEEEWETLGGRLDRGGALPFSVIVGDCNPDRPSHWIRARAERGQLTLVHTRLEDNPAFHDGEHWTEAGERYRSRLLSTLTGVRRKRYLDGLWVAAEGMIYEDWNPDLHVIPRRELPEEWPTDIAIDFGYVNPFVAQVWREDPDGVLILEREIYKTQTLVEDHAEALKAYLGDRRPRQVICDHDAEGRATFERKTGWRTVPADKAVTAGIQEVQSRLTVKSNGRPGLQIMRDAVLTVDASLREAGKPTSTAEEFESYVWDTNNGAARGERPVKENDHGMDALRYLCKRKARPAFRSV